MEGVQYCFHSDFVLTRPLQASGRSGGTQYNVLRSVNAAPEDTPCLSTPSIPEEERKLEDVVIERTWGAHLRSCPAVRLSELVTARFHRYGSLNGPGWVSSAHEVGTWAVNTVGARALRRMRFPPGPLARSAAFFGCFLTQFCSMTRYEGVSALLARELLRSGALWLFGAGIRRTQQPERGKLTGLVNPRVRHQCSHAESLRNARNPALPQAPSRGRAATPLCRSKAYEDYGCMLDETVE
ncbi:hypothetical protein C8Q72DRAFT_792875 [Fomitopsis betulina]|nr:hypothetical protein C8Q72DRAFT_792875 [Fomitopsis betulina]